ncbi:hypothetical protein BC832DRAFT_546245 [Gaertneriomyces semiglobifer]|nr:hypothetical protein BC832DRAFT_546245 [Gaertneriomyces semiglobifer]
MGKPTYKCPTSSCILHTQAPASRFLKEVQVQRDVYKLCCPACSTWLTTCENCGCFLSVPETFRPTQSIVSLIEEESESSSTSADALQAIRLHQFFHRIGTRCCSCGFLNIWNDHARRSCHLTDGVLYFSVSDTISLQKLIGGSNYASYKLEQYWAVKVETDAKRRALKRAAYSRNASRSLQKDVRAEIAVPPRSLPAGSQTPSPNMIGDNQSNGGSSKAILQRQEPTVALVTAQNPQDASVKKNNRRRKRGLRRKKASAMDFDPAQGPIANAMPSACIAQTEQDDGGPCPQTPSHGHLLTSSDSADPSAAKRRKLVTDTLTFSGKRQGVDESVELLPATSANTISFSQTSAVNPEIITCLVQLDDELAARRALLRQIYDHEEHVGALHLERVVIGRRQTFSDWDAQMLELCYQDVLESQGPANTILTLSRSLSSSLPSLHRTRCAVATAKAAIEQASGPLVGYFRRVYQLESYQFRLAREPLLKGMEAVNAELDQLYAELLMSNMRHSKLCFNADAVATMPSVIFQLLHESDYLGTDMRLADIWQQQASEARLIQRLQLARKLYGACSTLVFGGA